MRAEGVLEADKSGYSMVRGKWVRYGRAVKGVLRGVSGRDTRGVSAVGVEGNMRECERGERVSCERGVRGRGPTKN
jgi:hypothetical protein